MLTDDEEIQLKQPILTIPCPYSFLPPIPRHIAHIFSSADCLGLSTNSSGASNAIMGVASGTNSGALLTLIGNGFNELDGRLYSFIIPYGAVVKKVMISVRNDSVTPTATIYPYAALAVAPSGERSFTILNETETLVHAPLVAGGVVVSSNLTWGGESNELTVPIQVISAISICYDCSQNCSNCIQTEPHPGIIMPFATGGGATATTTTITTDASGASRNVMGCEFGHYNGTAITLTNEGIFTQPTGRLYSFIISYYATLKSIHMEVITGASWTPTALRGTIPYVALAVAPSGSNQFTVLTETIT